jgi:hypothetical protein
LLYLGRWRLAAGIGWTVTTYSGRLGDVVILSALIGILSWSLYFCFSRGLPHWNTYAAVWTLT